MSWTRFPAPTAVLAAAGTAALLLMVPTTAQAREAPPQLSIAVDSAATSAAVGDTLSYVITVNNLGDTRVRGLRVSQTMPEGLDFGSADQSGKAGRGSVQWTVDLAANGEATLRTTMEVATTPKEVLRLATVACAAVDADEPPLVCATHSALLPAGAAAESRSAATDDEAQAGALPLSTIAFAGLGGLLLVAALGAVALWWRATRATRQEGRPGHSSGPRGSD